MMGNSTQNKIEILDFKSTLFEALGQPSYIFSIIYCTKNLVWLSKFNWIFREQ